MSNKKLNLIFTIRDKKTKKTLYAIEVTLRGTPKELKRPMAAASLIYMEDDLLKSVLSWGWSEKKLKARSSRRNRRSPL